MPAFKFRFAMLLLTNCIRIFLLSGPICFNQEQDHEWDRMRPDSAGQDKIGRTGRDPRDWIVSVSLKIVC